MRDAIKNLNRQFAFQPKIEHKGTLRKYKKFLVCGMGGSRIPAEILKLLDPELDVVVWNDYGTPSLPDLKDRLAIFMSYSGGTEEIIYGFREAKRRKLRRAVIAVGGRLLELAKKERVPYVAIPNTGIQPRMGTAFMMRALMKLMGDEKGLRESGTLAKTLDAASFEAMGKRLALGLAGCVPVVYASRANTALAWNWKIKMNETGKVPAFANVFPEMNHNEMTGFDPVPSTRPLVKPFHIVLLEDAADHPRIQLRMKVVRDLLRARGLRVTTVPVMGANKFLKVFSSLAYADWTAFHLAMHYGAEADKVPMVEDLKKRLA